MADYYFLVLDCIGRVQDSVQAKHGTKLELNEHQCMLLANELLIIPQSLQDRDLQNLKLVEDIRIKKVLLHLHRAVKQAQMLVENCCCANSSSWLSAAITLRDIKEEVAAIFLDVHQWTFNMVIAIASVKGSFSSGDEVLNCFKTGENDYQRLLESLHASEHKLHTAALQDREKLLKRVTDFLSVTQPKEADQPDDDYLRGIYLKSQLTHPKGDLQSEEKLKVCHLSLRCLGRGASGRVSKEHWLGEEVALKELGMVDKIEATLLDKIRHPNVVQLFHYFEILDEYPRSCIVMELMPRDLRKHIETELEKKSTSKTSCNMPFLLPVAIDIMLQVAEAMRHLHDRNLTHRDLKTLNILVKLVDKSMSELHTEGYLKVKLADFGTAKAYSHASTATPLTHKKGTPIYGAPEIFEKEEIKRDRNFPPKADIWSFGMTCYEILSTKPPFENETLSTLHEKIREGLRPSLPADCPQYLKFCITSCWKLQPEERPSFTDLCRLLRYAKLLSLGLLNFDGTNTSSLFEYQTRGGSIIGMNISSASSQRNSSTYDGAREDLHAADSPNMYYTLRECGLVKKRSGDIEGALRDLNAAYKHKPNDFFTLQQRGIVKMMLADYKGALTDLNGAYKTMPNDVCTLQHRSHLKMSLGDIKGALTDLNLLGDLPVALRSMGGIGECIPKMETIVRQRGILRMKFGDYQGALKDLICSQGLVEDEDKEDDDFSLQERGTWKADSRDLRLLDEVVSVLKAQLHQLDHEDRNSKLTLSYALQQRSAVKMRLRDPQGALTDLNAADQTIPNDAYTLKHRGIVKKELRDFTGALKDLDEADNRIPNDYATLQHRGVVKQELKEYAGALTDLDAADKLNPKDCYTLQHRGAVRKSLGDFKGAKKDLNEAYKRNPSDLYTLQHLQHLFELQPQLNQQKNSMRVIDRSARERSADNVNRRAALERRRMKKEE